MILKEMFSKPATKTYLMVWTRNGSSTTSKIVAVSKAITPRTEISVKEPNGNQ